MKTQKKIYVFFPGSFRPPSKNHWNSISQYVDIAEKLFVLVSKQQKSKRLDKFGREITQEQAVEIFELYKKASGFKNVEIVKVASASPIFSALGYIKHNLNAETDAVLIGTSDKDDDVKRADMFKAMVNKDNPNMEVLDARKYLAKNPPDYAQGSATQFRNNIDNFEVVADRFLPDVLSLAQKKEVFNILNPETPIDEDLNTARIGLDKVAKLNPTAAKRMLTPIVDGLKSSGKYDIEIFPKSDGQTVRLAWDSTGKISIESSHSGLISDPEQVKIESFRKTLEYFQQPKIAKKLNDVLNKVLPNPISEVYGLKIIGELLYNSKDNQDADGSITYVGTKYDSTQLGSLASIILFDSMIINDDTLTPAPAQVTKKVLDLLQNQIGNKEVSFFTNDQFTKIVTLKTSEFSKDNQRNIENFDTLKKDQIEALKYEVNDLIVKQCDNLKPFIVKSDLEGLIFAVDGHQYAVQNPKWIETKKNYYQYNEEYEALINKFVKDVTGFVQRKKIQSIFDANIDSITLNYQKYLKKFQEDLTKAYNNFNDHINDMPKFVYFNNRKFMEYSYTKLMALTPNINSFRDFIFFKSNTTNESSLLREGGNMFSGEFATSRINQENVAATLQMIAKTILPELGAKPEYTAVLGSTGKKLKGGSSGDIDLAFDLTKMQDKSEQDFIRRAEQIGKKLGYEARIMPGLNLCSYRLPIVNTDGKQDGEYVQLDLMPSNDIEFMKWGMYSPAEKDYAYKGTVRNELLQAIASFSQLNVLEYAADGKTPVTWERLSFVPQGGLFKVQKSVKPAREGKPLLKNAKNISKSLVTKDPDKIIQTLFGNKYKSSDILTGNDALEAFKTTNLFKNPEYRDAIIAKCLNGLKRKEVAYPPEFEELLQDKSLLK